MDFCMCPANELQQMSRTGTSEREKYILHSCTNSKRILFLTMNFVCQM